MKRLTTTFIPFVPTTIITGGRVCWSSGRRNSTAAEYYFYTTILKNSMKLRVKNAPDGASRRAAYISTSILFHFSRRLSPAILGPRAMATRPGGFV